jgi:chitodextrinase
MGGTGPTYYGWSPTNTKGPTTGDYVIDYVRVYQKSTDQTAPSTPTSLSASYNQTNSSALLSWNASTDNVGVTGYEVWRSVGTSTFSKVADTTTNSYTNTGLSASTNYNYYVKAKDAAGNVSAQSNTASLTTPTQDAPPTAKIDTPGDGLAVFSTTQINATASDDKGITKVEYFVDGVSIGTSASSSSPYTITWDTTKYLNGSHSVYVRVTDTAGQSTVSSTVNPIVQNLDTQKPSAPTNLTAVATAYNTVSLSWTASTDNVGVNVYYVVRDGATIAQISGSATSYTDLNRTASTTYSYYIIAQDAVGNTSANSNTAVVTTPAVPDTTPPTAPTNLSAQVASSTQINLNWSASTDNVGVASYDVYRGSSKIANVSSTSFGDVGLSPGLSYTYYVVAIDPSNNRSANSNQVNATIPAEVTTGILNGQVTRSTNGTGVGQAYVTILDSLGNRLYQVRTNSSGFYSIQAIKQGTYNVRFAKNKFNDLVLQQNIQPGIVQILNAIMVPK